MFSEEWALMLFTLFSQLAVGTFLILIIVRSVLAKKDAQAALGLTKLGMTAVGPVMLLSLILSVFHLGSPLIAYRSLGNLGSSWLSREILTAGGFLLLWAVNYYSYKNEKTGNVLAWVTSIVGLAVIFSMASIYASSIRPAWTNINTYVAFFGTTFVLGSIAAAAAILYSLKGAKLQADVVSALKTTAVIGGLAVLIPLIYLPVYTAGLSSGGAAAQASAKLLVDGYSLQFVVRWIFTLVGLGLLYFFIRKHHKANQAIPMNMVYLALALVLVGEFIGRYIFYASAVSIMVG